MDDMTAFERQLAAELEKLAGPGRHIDAVAMVRTVSTESPKWRFPSLVAATKFVGAAAIVALFGGFLLAGALMQPGEDSPPAGGSPSAEPRASGEAVALAWERVEVPAGMDLYFQNLRHSTGTYFIASSPDQTLVSRDGLAWSEVPVQGEVIAAYGGSLVVVDGDRLSTVLVAEEAGASEEPLLDLDGLVLPSGVSRPYSPIAFGPAGLVVVACDAECETSTVWHTADGRSWERVYESPGEGWEEVVATPDGFVARTDRGGDFTVMHSGNGRDWDRIDSPTFGRYGLVGSAPFGTVLQEPSPDGSPTHALSVVTPDKVERLTVPAEVEAWWTSSMPDGWGAGSLGVVGITDGMVALSTDGSTWHLGTLPDTVPRLLFGDNGYGRPILHVAEDVVLLETRVCLQRDGREVDCPELWSSGDKQMWFRGTPSATASAPAEPSSAATAEPGPASSAESTNALDSTIPDLVSLAGLITEEVEPGVHRVLSDGVRDLSTPVAYNQMGDVAKRRIVAAPDGGVWVFGSERFFRLGDPDVDPDISYAGVLTADVWDVDKDGNVWALLAPDGDEGFGCRQYGPPHLVVFDGEQWDGKLCNVVDFDLDPDGTPRVVIDLSVASGPGGLAIGRVRDGAFDEVGAGEPGEWGGMALRDGFQGFAMSPPDPSGDPTVTDAGWLIDAAGNLNDVQLMTDGGGMGCCHNESGRVVAVGFAADRSSWVMLEFEVPNLEGDSLGSASAYYLARFSPMPASRDEYPRQLGVYESALPDHRLLDTCCGVAPRLDVAPDGALWLPSEDGLARFDGLTWDWYLPGMFIEDVDIASDGTIWVQANDLGTGPQEPPHREQDGTTATFVITPEAVAATE